LWSQTILRGSLGSAGRCGPCIAGDFFFSLHHTRHATTNTWSTPASGTKTPPETGSWLSVVAKPIDVATTDAVRGGLKDDTAHLDIWQVDIPCDWTYGRQKCCYWRNSHIPGSLGRTKYLCINFSTSHSTWMKNLWTRLADSRMSQGQNVMDQTVTRTEQRGGRTVTRTKKGNVWTNR
jgi:hypothetical protein